MEIALGNNKVRRQFSAKRKQQRHYKMVSGCCKNDFIVGLEKVSYWEMIKCNEKYDKPRLSIDCLLLSKPD